MILLSVVRYYAYSLPIFYAGWVHAADSDTSFAVNNATISTYYDAATTTGEAIAFSSAVEIEASVSVQLQQLASVPAVPLPTDVADTPEYQAVSQLAPVLPPIPAGVVLPGSEAMMKHIIASSNTSDTAGSLVGRQNNLRVLIVGDSMTQGREGDFTWRYRIWEWFQKNGIKATFVGPYKGTVPAQEPKPPQPPPLYGVDVQPVPYGTNGGYAGSVNSAFLSNSNHFSVWGRAAAVDKGLIKGVLDSNPADLMLVMIGFNDLGWFYSDAPGLIDSLSTLVSNARAANPSMKFAIANIPHRSRIGGRQDLVDSTILANKLLPDAIKKWTTPQSPINLVDVASKYDCGPSGCPAGYDGLHPNAWGEFLIASAFSNTLVNSFSLGNNVLSSPSQGDQSVAKSLDTPTNFKVFSSPQGVTATWDPVKGAYGYDVKVSVAGGLLVTDSAVNSNRWDSQYPGDGWTYEVSVRATAGDDNKGRYTASKTAVAKPQLAPPPRNVRVKATASGMEVTWDPPKGEYTDSIVEYNVIFWDWTPDHCSFLEGAAFKSSPAKITGLVPGRNYKIWVVTWNKNGESMPAQASNIIVGGGTPSTPQGLELGVIDATSIRLTWGNDGRAGGYHVWSRLLTEKGSKPQIIANVSDSACNEEYMLFPGAWNYGFSVSAFNGDAESPASPERSVPSPASGIQQGNKDLKCPPLEKWCASGGEVTVPTKTGSIPGPTESGSTTPVRDYPWAAIGDSFSAGPGAGDAWGNLGSECFQSTGAYPVQLHHDFPYTNVRSAMQFLSCTGAVVQDLMTLQVPHLDKDQGFILLSVGGNDIGFGKILKACVFKPGGPLSDNCDKAVNDAQDKLYRDEFRDSLYKLWDAIFKQASDDSKMVVIQQMYPSFFNEQTDWCDKQTMGIIPGYKPLLDKELRRTLNSLAKSVRDRLNLLIYDYSQQRWGNRGQRARLHIADYWDRVYSAHRFCEEGDETFDNPDIWFFTINGNDSPQTVTGQQLLDKYDPKTCKNDPRYDKDFAFGWYCDSVRYVATLDGKHQNFRTFAPESITKAFHPKTVAFTAVKNENKDAVLDLATPR